MIVKSDLRILLRKVLIGDADLSAFCIDFFPEIQSRFGSSMNRVEKENLLLTYADPEQLRIALRRVCPGQPPRIFADATESPGSDAASAAGRRSHLWRLAGSVMAALFLIALAILAARWHYVESGKARAQLDASLARNGDPAPPQSCQTRDKPLLARLTQAAMWLAQAQPGIARAQDREALRLLAEPGAPGSPPSAELQALLARAHLSATVEPASAYQAAADAVALCPDFALAHNLLGNAEQRRGNLSNAAAAYRQALRLAPSYVAPRFNLGLVALKLGDAATAVVMLDEALRQLPENANARMAHGQAHLMLGNLALANIDLEAATRLTPTDAAAWMLLGEVRLKQDQSGSAHAAFCQAAHLGHREGAIRCPEHR